MRFVHPQHEDRALRLAYCMNLHAGETLGELYAGLESITQPLHARCAPNANFGVGMYFPSQLALWLASADGAADLFRLRDALATQGLDPFTFNAFPFGDFHVSGLKQRVFEPAWSHPLRLDYTLDVARIAAVLTSERERFVTISTHPGRFGAWEAKEFERAAENFGHALSALAELREGGGPRIVLSLEAEPRAVAGTTPEVAALVARLREHLSAELGDELISAHLGVCLDACHSAVEFESAEEATRLALESGFGKLQFSSAIALREPARKDAARVALAALDEPHYLHQTTGRHAAELLRVDDLPELAQRCGDDARWLACEEWRTHFHVPVDLTRLGSDGLETTRPHADRILECLLESPASWGEQELQVEIETYTWDILPSAARGAGELVDGLSREYGHVISRLNAAGWIAAD